MLSYIPVFKKAIFIKLYVINSAQGMETYTWSKQIVLGLASFFLSLTLFIVPSFLLIPGLNHFYVLLFYPPIQYSVPRVNILAPIKTIYECECHGGQIIKVSYEVKIMFICFQFINSDTDDGVSFSFFYEWEHRTGTMRPFSSLHPLKKGKEVQ